MITTGLPNDTLETKMILARAVIFHQKQFSFHRWRHWSLGNSWVFINSFVIVNSKHWYNRALNAASEREKMRGRCERSNSHWQQTHWMTNSKVTSTQKADWTLHYRKNDVDGDDEDKKACLTGLTQCTVKLISYRYGLGSTLGHAE